jgi:hypothetical protein
MNAVAVPPWGQVVGFSAYDHRQLVHIAAEFDKVGPNNVAVALDILGEERGRFSNSHRAPLSNVKLVTPDQARQRYEQVPLLSPIRDSLMQVKAPLICFWDANDTDEVIRQNPRDDILLMIHLMKLSESSSKRLLGM